MRDGEGDAERDGKLVLFPHVCERPRFTGPFVFLEVGKKSILGEFLFYGIIDEMDPEISKKFEELKLVMRRLIFREKRGEGKSKI